MSISTTRHNLYFPPSSSIIMHHPHSCMACIVTFVPTNTNIHTHRLINWLYFSVQRKLKLFFESHLEKKKKNTRGDWSYSVDPSTQQPPFSFYLQNLSGFFSSLFLFQVLLFFNPSIPSLLFFYLPLFLPCRVVPLLHFSPSLSAPPPPPWLLVLRTSVLRPLRSTSLLRYVLGINPWEFAGQSELCNCCLKEHREVQKD